MDAANVDYPRLGHVVKVEFCPLDRLPIKITNYIIWAQLLDYLTDLLLGFAPSLSPLGVPISFATVLFIPGMAVFSVLLRRPWSSPPSRSAPLGSIPLQAFWRQANARPFSPSATFSRAPFLCRDPQHRSATILALKLDFICAIHTTPTSPPACCTPTLPAAPCPRRRYRAPGTPSPRSCRTPRACGRASRAPRSGSGCRGPASRPSRAWQR